MKSPTLIAILALALLAIPPLFQTDHRGPDLSDVSQLEKQFPAPSSADLGSTVEIVAAAPHIGADLCLAPASADVAAVAAPCACDHGPTLVNAAEHRAIHRHAYHDPGRQIRWRSESMKRTAGESSDIITAVFRPFHGSGGGEVVIC